MIKKLKSCCQCVCHAGCSSFALLILRVVAGSAFVFHGWGKIQSPFSWMPTEVPVPGFFQFLAALSEFGGGIAWILGFLTMLGSFGIACTMAVAVFMHMVINGDPFVHPMGGPSYELASIFLAIAILFFVMGPGKYSLDAKIFGERK